MVSPCGFNVQVTNEHLFMCLFALYITSLKWLLKSLTGLCGITEFESSLCVLDSSPLSDK